MKKSLLATVVAGTLLLGVTSATSDYMHYQDGTISICDPSSNGTKCITMQDKNLGASEAGTGVASYGKHFQWGNNHGFASCNSNDCTTFPGGENTSKSQINCSANSPSNPVNRGAFIVRYEDYCTTSTRNDNLRGGENDTGGNNYGYDEENNVAYYVENRQGPCGEGYHVPSQGERGTLLKYWAANYTGAGNTLNLSYLSGLPKFSSNATAAGQFQEDFKIPFAGFRHYNAEVLDVGDSAYLWSSSPTAGDENARGFYLYPGGASAYYDDYRASAFSVRCFKDSYLSFPSVSYIEPTDTDIQVTVGQTVYNELPNIMTVTPNTVQQAEGKPVLGEVSVSFGSNESAKFSKLVKVNVPVDSVEQVIIKVKHAGSSEYNFDGLTTNVNASCNNGRPTSNQYNGETITVVDGFASIYTCEASDFVALGVENGGDSLITVNIAEFNGGQNTCTGSNFIFENIVAGTNTGTHTLSGVFECAFGNGRTSSIVTLQLSGNLVADGDRVISGSNLKMKNSEWTVSPVGLKFANTLINTWNALTATQTLFQKTANLIGVASGVVEVQLTVPGGTPDGTYNGTLVLTY